MSRTSFDNFGRLASRASSWTELAGRYSLQGVKETSIVADIANKLRLRLGDTLLEIGCGAGNLLVPLRKLVASATGIDHLELTSKLQGRDRSIHVIPGNFLDLAIDARFSKILIYSVLHYLSDGPEVVQFVEKAASLLEPGGLLLLGDLTNADRKYEFENSAHGQSFLEEWRKKTAGELLRLESDPRMVMIDEALILHIVGRFHDRGYIVARLHQNEQLPFCHTREDMLIESTAAL